MYRRARLRADNCHSEARFWIVIGNSVTVSAQCSLAINTQTEYYELLPKEQRTKQKT